MESKFCKLRTLVFTSLIAIQVSSSASTIVEVSNGLLNGTRRVTRLGRDIDVFLGIPYAKPPVGQLRFEPPQPAANWSGVRDASAFGSQCYQPGGGSEDCLYLNVFSPNLGQNVSSTGELFAVMVFVHGGSFQGGNPNGNVGTYILDEDIVLVTINYRLHSLGFLNTGGSLVRGNMGMKDMALALRWIQDNIARFGGDPSRVTVFGQSAGGAAISYLLLSPLTAGLLRGAISHSGSAIKIWSFQPKPAEQAQLLASRLNCPLSPEDAMVACLKNADVEELTRQSTLSGDALKNDLEVFTPSIETVREGAFISKHPYDIIRDGEAHRVPWITGVNSGEGLLYTYPIRDSDCLTGRIDSNWTAMGPKFLFYDATKPEITRKITQFYFGNATINFRTQFDKFTQLWSDRYYITFTRRAGELQSKFSPVYFYYNNYQKNPGGVGVADHGEEIFLLFPGSPAVGVDSVHYNISRDLVNLWAQFAQGGLNNDFPYTLYYTAAMAATTNEYVDMETLNFAFRNLKSCRRTTLNFEGSSWEPIDTTSGGGDGVKYLFFNNSGSGIVTDPIRERVQLWNELDLYRIEPVFAGEIAYC